MEIDERPIEEVVNQRIRQFLVHSFLYYKLDHSITADHNYDRWTHELYGYKEKGLTKNHKYHKYLDGLEKSGSGFYIRDYPPEIESTALKLLHFNSYEKEDFVTFLSRFGRGLDTSKGDLYTEGDILYVNKDLKMTKDEIWTDQRVKVKRGKTLKSGNYDIMAIKDNTVKILFKKHYYFIDMNKFGGKIL